jgi:glycosyltransferase involved in cell wall biosynthesis
MKILHLPTAVAGNSYGLSRGERSLGYRSDVLVARDNDFRYPADRILVGREVMGRPAKFFCRVREAGEFFRIRRGYEVYHFNGGTSLVDLRRFGLHLLDLPFYPKKARLVFTYNGCDARLSHPAAEANPYGPCREAAACMSLCADERHDYHRRRAIAKMDRHAGAIFALNPDILRYLPARAQFLPYTISSWAGLERNPAEPGRGRVLNVVHAPSDRMTKGSETILTALRALAEKYPGRLRLQVVEKLPQKQALPLYARADLVIDQIRLGWYGGLTVEVMKMGRPVLAYIREEDLDVIPPEMRRDLQEAVINATPETLPEVLSDLLENPGQLAQYAQAGYDYVHRWHDPVKVARRTTAAYEAISV